MIDDLFSLCVYTCMFIFDPPLPYFLKAINPNRKRGRYIERKVYILIFYSFSAGDWAFLLIYNFGLITIFHRCN
jgi:hypothetical protein